MLIMQYSESPFHITFLVNKNSPRRLFSSSTDQKISYHENTTVQHRYDKSSSVRIILNQCNCVHVSTTNFPEIHINVIYPPISKLLCNEFCTI